MTKARRRTRKRSEIAHAKVPRKIKNLRKTRRKKSNLKYLRYRNWMNILSKAKMETCQL